ncbi:MAG TPA: Hsp20/alpha crystallin family protein [bacterium]|nr:Hsp20/alpha crystallin family protein [bacterium]
MAIVRWTPDRHWMTLQEEMNRLFEDFVGPSTSSNDIIWAPRVDISETSGDILVRAELPGVNPESISVDLTNNTLTIQGEKTKDDSAEGENFYRVERIYGKFMRSFSLPSRLKADAVKARYKDGILFVTIPKAEEAKPREIKVEVE